MKLSVADVAVKGKRVLLRVDFNVPLSGERVVDDTRIRAALPTITDLLKRGARLILATHLGRPGGEIRPELRLDPVAARLSELLGRPVCKVDEVVGREVEEAVRGLAEGEVLMLENIRFEQAKRLTTPILPVSWRNWPIYLSTMPSEPPIAPMLPPPEWLNISPLWRGC